MTSQASDQTRQKLVRMANQIASFFATQPGDKQAADTAAHIRDFWDPSMRATLAQILASGGDGLGPIARSAAEQLQTART